MEWVEWGRGIELVALVVHSIFVGGGGATNVGIFPTYCYVGQAMA